MAKQKDKSEEVWAEKEGFPRRKFKLMQLEAMGTDPGGKSYDGWKIVKEATEPAEVKSAKAATKAEPKKAATKNDSDNGDIQEAKDAAATGSDDSGSVGKDPAQGGEGN